MILDKKMTIATFWNTILSAKVMHQNTYRLWSVHGVASSSKIRRLTNGYASSTTLGCLRFPKIYLIAVGTTGLLFLFCGGV
jgi:hypothetical protein